MSADDPFGAVFNARGASADQSAFDGSSKKYNVGARDLNNNEAQPCRPPRSSAACLWRGSCRWRCWSCKLSSGWCLQEGTTTYEEEQGCLRGLTSCPHCYHDHTGGDDPNTN
ncbi:hypothetical protein N9L68_06880 [bacterium]|nr:hypothetical protein [bacterium]MDA8583939.1 hypothetical protein [bacterium]